MTLRLYYHPFSSFCQKALVALYEREVAFEREPIDLSDPAQKAKLEAVWPIAKFPVLRDEGRGLTIPESGAIVEYVDRLGSGPPRLIPTDPDEALQVRIWERVIDDYVELPLQRRVKDCFRPAEHKDPLVVDEAKTLIGRAYGLLDDALYARNNGWLACDSFTLADCAAAPALFYSNIIVPFAGHPRLEAYFARLLARPSFARAVEEARPFRPLFPFEWPDSYR